MNQIDDLLNSLNATSENSDVPFGLNTTICKHLGLLDKDGRGLQEVTIDLSTNKVHWSIPALYTPIFATSLLTMQNKAVSEIAFAFIVKNFQIKLIKGTTYETAIFNRTDLAAITSCVTAINPILGKSAIDTGYAVTGGNFVFHFKNSNKQMLRKDFHVPLKNYDEKDIINPVITKLAKELTLKDADMVDNLKINFVIGKQGPTPNMIKNGIFVNINKSYKVGKQFNSLNKLLPFFIRVRVKKVNINYIKYIWGSGDSLTLEYFLEDTLNSETVLYITPFA